MNYYHKKNPIIFQPLGDPLFVTYPWRVWVAAAETLSVSIRMFGLVQRQVLTDKQMNYLTRAGVEYRRYFFPAPNVRFRTEEEATFFLLKYPH